MAIRPVFLLSLPRSGSTLVQRVLATYPEIATQSEPWILLPFLSPVSPSMPLADSWQGTVSGAVRDFIAELPEGEDDYYAGVHDLALGLYGKLGANGATYFLDKTPSYHLVLNHLFRLFPEGKFIFLWRNPLSVVASVVETFSGGRWDTYQYRGDLFHGVANLTAGYERHRPRSFAVRYEDLVTGAEEPWRRLTSYLELEFEPDSLSRFAQVGLSGRMGDQKGTRAYGALSQEPLGKWRRSVCNPLRRWWCMRYVTWIGRERLAIMGYDLDELLRGLEGGSMSYDRSLSDALDMGESVLREIVRTRLPNNRLANSWRLLLGTGPPT